QDGNLVELFDASTEVNAVLASFVAFLDISLSNQHFANATLLFVGKGGFTFPFLGALVHPAIASLTPAWRPVEELAKQDRLLEPNDLRHGRVVGHWPTKALNRV